MFYVNDLDGFKFYWYDLHKEHDLFSKRQFGGRSGRVLAAFAAGGATQIVFVENKMNSVLYWDILADSVANFSSDYIRRLNISTKQSICAYLILHKILDESSILQIPGKNSSTAISESRPESNVKTFEHSGSICLQECATAEKQV
ncbi:hypothetical protein AVEN_23078-1 [Araneus ventricosus]|uniref:Uncharacterized protein n=1 Tax=Araneus ventricosus TaxID=182803 RepID=A0A4Y2JC68_ARAVE|nr:hypothetical protein AVEN_23078-1 [Araneus ventricosus]